MSRGKRPVALGLVHHRIFSSDAERRRIRISLALKASLEGFALAEILEVDGGGVTEDTALASLEHLAEEFRARAVLVAGPCDRERVLGIAARRRLRVIVVSRPAGLETAALG